MANVFDTQIIEEGPRNVLVKVTGTLDTSDVSIVPAVHVQDFVNNDNRAGVLYAFRVDLIEWSMSNGLEILLEWDSAAPQQILPIAGRGRIHASGYGGMVPNVTKPGFTGNINLKTSGFVVGTVQNFSVMFELIKMYKNI